MSQLSLLRLLRNLRAGTALACARPVGLFNFTYGQNQLIELISAFIAVLLLKAYLTTTWPVGLNVYGVGSLTSYAFIIFISIYLATALNRTPTMFTAFSVIILSAHLYLYLVVVSVVAVLEAVLPPKTDDFRTLTQWIIFGWSLLIVFRANQILFGRSLIYSAALATAFTSVSLAAHYWIPAHPLLLTQKEVKLTKNGASRPKPDVERTYYAQSKLIDDYLENLAKSRPDVTDLYFLGFAGYGEQDVFMHEILAAATLFDQRFDTNDRSIMLINNHATLRAFPMANMHNLTSVLRGIAAAMDTEQDILFLFLSSHGWHNGILSTAFQPFGLNNISANGLARQLDKSGIKWRVIVVSACYSGSFIDALRNEHTLIITASRADRNSFGCADEAEFTYFGRAFFDEALRSESSFIRAFEIARDSIAKREEAENFTPSEPQMVVGGRIRNKLRELERRLRSNQGQRSNSSREPYFQR